MSRARRTEESQKPDVEVAPVHSSGSILERSAPSAASYLQQLQSTGGNRMVVRLLESARGTQTGSSDDPRERFLSQLGRGEPSPDAVQAQSQVDLAPSSGAHQAMSELGEDLYLIPRSQTDSMEGEEEEESDDAVASDTTSQGVMQFDGPQEAGTVSRPSESSALVRQDADAGPAQAQPSPDDIVGDAVVSWALVMAWNDSNPNAPDVPRGSPGSKKHEQGGWILQNPVTGALSVQRVPRGSRDGLGPIVGTRPAETATQRVVAWFHTHPNTSAEGYVSDPSPADVAWQAAEAHVPGIILTHDGTKFIPFQ